MISKITHIIVYLFKSFLRFLGRMLKQLAGIFVFALLAAMEVGDWTSLMARYSDPEKDAAALGITTQASSTHLLVMVILSIGIVIAALATTVGLFQDGKWSIRASQVTGALFVVYGLYQIYFGFTSAIKSKENLILPGVVFAVIGIAVFGLGSKFVQVVKPAQRQPAR